MDIDKLKAAGIDYDDGLKRFSGNVAIYNKYLVRFIDLTLLDETKEALDRCDITGAFEACHKLKAYTGNLSMNELYEKVSDLTERLRAGITSGINGRYDNVEKEYRSMQKKVAEALYDE